MTPQSGGQTVFVRRAFGAYPGFAVAWSDWLSTCASVTAVTIVFTDALVALLPRLAAHHAQLVMATILAFAAAQWSGIRNVNALQVATSVLKATAFLALIIACLITTPAQPTAVAQVPARLGLAGLMLALQLMIFTYDGWTGALYFSGEVRDPGRDIVRSTVSGVLSVVAIYLLINIAFLHQIPLHAMAGDPLVADSAARAVFGRAGVTIVRLLIAASLLSCINALLLIATRVFYAMGAARVSGRGTPTTALLVSAIVAVLFTASGAFNIVIVLASFFFVANYAVSFCALFRLRRTEPDAPRPYRAWGHPFTTGLVLLASLAFLIGAVAADARHSLYALALLAASYPVFQIMAALNAKREREMQQ